MLGADLTCGCGAVGLCQSQPAGLHVPIADRRRPGEVFVSQLVAVIAS